MDETDKLALDFRRRTGAVRAQGAEPWALMASVWHTSTVAAPTAPRTCGDE